MLNKIIVMGRLVRDPEMRRTTTGVAVTNFTVAVDRDFKDKETGETTTDFIDCVAWRNTAEFVCRNFGKGALIAVDGQLQSRQYQAKDGTNRTVVEVVADNVSFTGERRDPSASYSQPARDPYSQVAPAAPVYSHGTVDDFQEMPLDDDLPF